MVEFENEAVTSMRSVRVVVAPTTASACSPASGSRKNVQLPRVSAVGWPVLDELKISNPENVYPKGSVTSSTHACNNITAPHTVRYWLIVANHRPRQCSMLLGCALHNLGILHYFADKNPTLMLMIREPCHNLENLPA